MKKKVFVGLSGGVDSAVTAALLVKQGFDVTGVFMKNWSGDEYGIADQCPWRRDLDDSIDVCKTLGIPHKTYNFEREYQNLVIDNFFSEYKAGRTPNPDVLCNKFIKFDLFMKKALSEGADYIATGHYSKIENGQLFKAKDTNKDQTYFLYQLTKAQLEKSIFPLADITKPEVRILAKEFNIPVSEKKDSQGICFVGKVNINKFLKEELPVVAGDFIDLDSKKVVGQHEGHWFYTIGQRKGIKIGGSALPYYVSGKDIENNIIYLVKGKENPALWKSEMIIDDFHLINSETKVEDLKKLSNLTATVRYRTKDTPINIEWILVNNCLVAKTIFVDYIWAPAIGQSLVLFDDKECIGGGVLTSIV
jgi:tRNA-specific 2-thiouridylase